MCQLSSSLGIQVTLCNRWTAVSTEVSRLVLKPTDDTSNPNVRRTLIQAAIRACYAASDPYVGRAAWEAACLFPYQPEKLLGDPTKVLQDEYAPKQERPRATRGKTISGQVLVVGKSPAEPETKRVQAPLLDMPSEEKQVAGAKG